MARFKPDLPNAHTRDLPRLHSRASALLLAHLACGICVVSGAACGDTTQDAIQRDSSVTAPPDSGVPRDGATQGGDDEDDGGPAGDPVSPLPPDGGDGGTTSGNPNDAGSGRDASTPTPVDASVPDAGTTPPDAGSTPDAGTNPDGGTDEPVAPGSTPETLKPTVLNRFPHDRQAFTQGLVWSEGRLFESTGLEGQSTLREVTLATGAVARRIANDADLFAEGLALVGTELIQLTWTEKRALVWKRDDFSKVREYTYTGEGWGLCYDGQQLVMSSGTDTLTIRDAKTFAVQREVSVTRAGRAQKNLNELECVGGRVYANVWQTDEIVRIDPRTGAIDAVIDAAGLLTAQEKQGADVLNGIAYMPENAHFLLTGKRWPTLFEVVFEKSP